jgi:phosphoribosyl 1,2-cyclic phosphate phosphodiesterase
VGDKSLLIDCGPDFREQALRYQIDHLSGLLLTHAHHDHTGGIDELRVYFLRSGRALPCLLSEETASDIKRRFHYIFDDRDSYAKLTTKFCFQILAGERGESNFLGLKVRYLTYEQGGMQVNGFRFGSLAYISDIRHYPETVFEDLEGVQTLIVSAVRFTPSHLHFTVDEAVEFAERVGAKETWLTHVTHELDHERTNAYLPSNVRMAYDGLRLEFQADISK